MQAAVLQGHRTVPGFCYRSPQQFFSFINRPEIFRSKFFQKFDALPNVFQGIDNSQKRCDRRGLSLIKIYPAAGFCHD